MKVRLSFLLFSSVFIHFFCLAGPRGSSFPYITGDTFRAYANFILDEENSFDPAKVFDKAIIFVKGDSNIDTKLLDKFFIQYHPNINARYLLITHNSHVPVSDEFKEYLEDPKLIAWFGKNITIDHPKAICIPIGFANKQWPHGNLSVYDQYIKKAQNGDFKKNKLLYMNFDSKTFISERRHVWNLLNDKSFCSIGQRKAFGPFLEDLSTSMFVVSPRGSGYDCHRTWEALLLGSYPIIKKSPIDKVYDDLPVVIIDDWAQVTEAFLHKKYEEFSEKSFKLEKLFFPYWLDLMKSYLENLRKEKRKG